MKKVIVIVTSLSLGNAAYELEPREGTGGSILRVNLEDYTVSRDKLDDMLSPFGEDSELLERQGKKAVYALNEMQTERFLKDAFTFSALAGAEVEVQDATILFISGDIFAGLVADERSNTDSQ